MSPKVLRKSEFEFFTHNLEIRQEGDWLSHSTFNLTNMGKESIPLSKIVRCSRPLAQRCPS